MKKGRARKGGQEQGQESDLVVFFLVDWSTLPLSLFARSFHEILDIAHNGGMHEKALDCPHLAARAVRNLRCLMSRPGLDEELEWRGGPDGFVGAPRYAFLVVWTNLLARIALLY